MLFLFPAGGRLPASISLFFAFILVALVRRVWFVLFTCGRLFLSFQASVAILPGWFFNRRGVIGFRPDLGLDHKVGFRPGRRLGCYNRKNRLGFLALRFVILRGGRRELVLGRGRLLNRRCRVCDHGFLFAGLNLGGNRRAGLFFSNLRRCLLLRDDFCFRPYGAIPEPRPPGPFARLPFRRPRWLELC